MTSLVFEDVRQQFGKRVVLQGVRAQVATGECLAVVGSNGAGKSCLLRIAAGQDRPTSGRATFAGRTVREESMLTRSLVAVSLGSPACYPDLTVSEHLSLVAVSNQVPNPDQRVRDILQEHRLQNHADVFPWELSAGQLQTLGLACVRIRPRQLTILDEPEQHLDASRRADLVRWIKEDARADRAVLLASHDFALVESVADRVLVLDEGNVVLHGACEETLPWVRS